jgi:hypothetical protein
MNYCDGFMPVNSVGAYEVIPMAQALNKQPELRMPRLVVEEAQQLKVSGAHRHCRARA